MAFNSLVGIGAGSEDANLICHLTMQETSGTAVDDRSSNTYDGTLSGSTIANGTGPTSYSTSSYDMNGTNHVITLNANVLVTGAGERTYCVWVKADAGADTRLFQAGNTNTAASGTGFAVGRRNTSAQLSALFNGHGVHCGDNSFPASTWMHVAIRVNASAADTGDIDMFINGSKQTLTTYTGSAQTLNTLSGVNVLGGGNNGSSVYFPGEFSEFLAFSRALTDAEVAEIAAGPEPEVTTAPTVSGSTPSGSTLTCSGQAAALPAPYASGTNGTVTWSYQWTNSVSGDIGAATSSTYVSQASDEGDNVGCDVLPSNDGGSYASEETSSSNTITVTASGPTYRMNMRLFIPTQV